VRVEDVVEEPESEGERECERGVEVGREDRASWVRGSRGGRQSSSSSTESFKGVVEVAGGSGERERRVISY